MKTLSHVFAAVTTSIWGRMALTAMGIAEVVTGCVAGSLFLLACGTVTLAGQLVMLASDHAVARIDAPSHISRSLADALRADYLADRLDTISFLARLEALYAARKSEITDWDSVGWDSPLCPMKGRWVWEDDQLIAAGVGPPGRSYFHDLARPSGVLSVPGPLALTEAEEMVKRWHTNHVGPSMVHLPGGMGPAVTLSGQVDNSEAYADLVWRVQVAHGRGQISANEAREILEHRVTKAAGPPLRTCTHCGSTEHLMRETYGIIRGWVCGDCHRAFLTGGILPLCAGPYPLAKPGSPEATADLTYRVTKAVAEGTLTPDTAREYLGHTPIRPPSTMDPQRGDHSRCQCLPGPQNHILLTIAERAHVLECWANGTTAYVHIPGDPGPTIFEMPV